MTFAKTTTAAALTLAMAASAHANTDNETVDHVEIGNLTCDIEDSTAFIVGSKRSLLCTFNPVQDGLADEVYTGEIRRFGLDVGRTENAKMQWLVYAPTEAEFSEGGLNGTYRGVSGEATFGVGLGANVLTLGSEDTLALQPVSLNAQNGVNLALGVAALDLTRVE